MTAAIGFRGITKRFGSLLANDSISFDVARGSVHALLGENGAGKSTLLSILAGFRKADEGSIQLDGRPVDLRSPREALDRGIGLCAQELLLAGALTGAENILLGRPGCRGPRAIPPERIRGVEALAARHALAVDLHRPVDDLSVAERERVEILKLLERDCSILVLDEPTSVLAPTEIASLFVSLRRLASEGKTILLVTHRLAEVFEVADSVSVLRGGRLAGEGRAADLDPATLVAWIAGEGALRELARPVRAAGRFLLEIEGASCGEPPRSVRSIDLAVREGEIVGLGGVPGNGQAELLDLLTGGRPLRAGRVRILGQTVLPGGRVDLVDSIGWIPDDRSSEGLARELSLRENLSLGVARGATPSEGAARDLLARFDVRPPDPRAPAAVLSGGNQQRLILAREFSRGARLLYAVHPTRGLDPAATRFVHGQILEARARGIGVLLVSADLCELTALSDSVAVLYRGEILYSERSGRIDRDRLHRALVGLVS